MRHRGLSRVTPLFVLLAAAAPAGANHDPSSDPPGSAPDAVHCTDTDDGTYDFVTAAGPGAAPAFGAFSAPPVLPTVLVVIGHGSTHTVESWRPHMQALTAAYGTLNVAMEYRGMDRVSGHHNGVDGQPNPSLPLAEKWPQKAGGEDLIAAAKRFQAACPTIQKTILLGVSMGVAMTGYAVSHLPPGDHGLFDYWVAVEGVHGMLETYHEAKAVSHPAAGWIEEETGGTPIDRPQEYQERTNLLKTAAIESAGLTRVVYLHAVYDGVVGYHQSRQMAQALQVPFEFYTVTTRGQGPDGSTLTDLFVDVGDAILAGHAGEWDIRALLMRASLERVGAIASGVPTACGEYHVEEGAVYPDVVFPPVATYSCDPTNNQAPSAEDDSAATLPALPVTIDVQSNDDDPDGDPLTTVAATPGQQGMTEVEADGRVTYTPNTGFSGGDSFDYIISDGAGGSDTATVLVPEPSRVLLLAAGAALLLGLGARRHSP